MLVALVAAAAGSACVDVGELDELARTAAGDEQAPAECEDGERYATNTRCGANDEGTLIRGCRDGRFTTATCEIPMPAPVCTSGEERNVAAPPDQGSCLGGAPYTQLCRNGQWDPDVRCSDACKFLKYECGVIDTTSCGACAEGFSCENLTHTCQPTVYGLKDPVTGYVWQAKSGSYSHDAAIRACADLEIGGTRGFRLASIAELRTLIDTCAPLRPGGLCRVSDQCTEVSCLRPENCFCASGELTQGACYGGAIYQSLFASRPDCQVLWSGTLTGTGEAWLLAFDASLNHREVSYRAGAACIFSASAGQETP